MTVDTVLRWVAFAAPWTDEIVIKKVYLTQLAPFRYQAQTHSQFERPLDGSVVIESNQIYGFFHSGT